MSTIAQYLQIVLYILLITSAATLILLLASLARRGPRSPTVGSLAKLIAAVTSLGTLMVSVLNVSTPLGATPEPDKAKQTIEQFYDAISDRNFDSAFRLIHRARLEEIRKVIPTFDRDKFAQTYDTTREYRNRFIALTAPSDDAAGRVYIVSFDVSDEVPRNRLYESRQTLVKDLAAQRILNFDVLMGFVFSNLRQYYEVPGSTEAIIKDYVANRQFESLLDPLFLSEIRRNLSVDYHVDLAPRVVRPSTVMVWRHFLQNLHLLKEDGTWKIRQGLAQPKAAAIYLQPAAP
jgi:hypothetical protein